MNKLVECVLLSCALIVGTQVQAQTEHPFLWTSSQGMRDLGALTATGNAVATGISDSGVVVGSSDVSRFAFHAFLWTAAEGMKDLGVLGPNYTDSSALDVNDFGQVVGWNFDFFRDRFTAFLWTEDGGMQSLGTLGGNSSQALAINSSGQVVGWSTDGAGLVRAFLWSAQRGITDIGTLGGFTATAYGIDDAGNVVGFSTLKHQTKPHAFLWNAATGMQDLGAPEEGCFAQDVNTSSVVVGYCGTLEGHQPFFWTPDGHLRRLDTFGLGGQANGVNSKNQVVGLLNLPGESHAVLWQHTGAEDLGTLGGNFSSAADINNHGAVVGYSYLK